MSKLPPCDHEECGPTGCKKSVQSSDLLNARAAFIECIKREQDCDEPWQKWSFQQHWAGKKHGFKDSCVQRAWQRFYDGWRAAMASRKYIERREN